MKFLFKRTLLIIFSFIFLFSGPIYSSDINQIIDNFTDNPGTRWQFYTDQVMGGVSTGKAGIKLD